MKFYIFLTVAFFLILLLALKSFSDYEFFSRRIIVLQDQIDELRAISNCGTEHSDQLDKA